MSQSNMKRIKLSDDDTLKRIPSDKTLSSVLYPVLSDDLINDTPLIEVYIDRVVNPKAISSLIVQLNAHFPIVQLSHLKRVRNGRDVLLFPTDYIRTIDYNPDTIHSILKNHGVDIVTCLANDIRKVMVAKVPPKVRRQYETIQKLWPCNFHSNNYLEKLTTNTLFSSVELSRHVDYMNVAIDLARTQKSNKTDRNNGVVVVDPRIDSIVAVGFDQSDCNPIKHAVMVAIDNVAKTQNGGAWNNDTNRCLFDELRDKYKDLSFGARRTTDQHDDDGPYLCTGYYVYSTHEPCLMCAMALIHGRAKRVFYGCKRVNGALSSLCKLHTIDNLNHHYEVFAGLLQDECAKL